MTSLTDLLEVELNGAVDQIQANMRSTKTDASGETSRSLRVVVVDDPVGGVIFAREFFSTVETGRGPRKSNVLSKFKENILRWMSIRGIGSNFDQKGKERLARFFTWRQNTIGSLLFRKGGRKDIFSNVLDKEFIAQLGDKIAKYEKDKFVMEVKQIIR